MARAILPVNLYTEWYWKNDLHNLLHFIGLRSDSHAQYEIRVFSDAMAKSVKEVAPFAWEAYQDYAVGGLRFSKIEQNILEKQLPNRVVEDILEDISCTRLLQPFILTNLEKENELYPLYKKQEVLILSMISNLNGILLKLNLEMFVN